MGKDDFTTLSIDGHDVRVSHPGKLYFTRDVKVTKLEVVNYYMALAEGALRGTRDRPLVLKRFVNGAEGEAFYQKRAPSDLPPYLRTITLSFPSGRTAEECVIDNAASLAWIANLGCLELHPHPVLTSDLDHPNELRVDLDPGPGVPWEHVRLVAMEVKAVLEEAGLRGWPKTSGSRGMHINVRIQPKWTFTEVRRAALALARAVERRTQLASSKWWKEERHGVFLDYNQNAKDRTTCSVYSIRPLPDARVSAPLDWDEVPACEPADFTMLTMPARFAAIGDRFAAIDDAPGSLDGLLELAARDESEGLGDAPWPPHFAKAPGEPKRVQPSKAKAFDQQMSEGFGAQRFRKRSAVIASGEPGAEVAAEDGAELPVKKPRKAPAKRVPKFPLIIISQSPDKAAAMAGLDRWRAAHPDAASLLAEDDVLVDRMRGTAYVWYRIRLNLRHVPEAERPAQATPDPDEDPTRAWREAKDEPPSSTPDEDPPSS